MTGPDTTPSRERLDLRAPVLALVAWTTALLALRAPHWVLLVVLLLGAVHTMRRWRRGQEVLSRVGWLVAACGVTSSALLRAEAVAHTEVTELARERAAVGATLVVTSDPVRRRGGHADYVVFRARTETVTGRGVRHRQRAPVLVIAPAGWEELPLGVRVRVAGRLQPARTRDLAGVLSTRGQPDVVEQPGALFRGAARVRS